MTSKEQNDGEISPEAATAYADRAALHQRIREGHLPDVDHLLAGSPFFAGDIVRDMQVWCDSWLLGTAIDDWQKVLEQVEQGILLRAVIQNVRDTGSKDALKAAERVLRKIDHGDADRMLCYLACAGDADARHRLVADSNRGGTWSHDEFDKMFITGTAVGLIYGRRRTMDGYCEAGLKIIEADAAALERFNAAMSAGEKAKGSLDAVVAAVAKADADIIDDVLDDRAEIIRSPALVVVSVKPDATSSRKEIIKSWGDKIGAALPLVERGDIAQHRRSLVARWPHASDLIDIALGDLGSSETVRFRPTLWVGPPGSGKSSLARAILEEVGLPCELQSLAGVHDAAMMGTSAQWSTARESTPLQLIKRSGKASVGMIWDEVEKIGSSTHNGSALDALLPMLEPDQAKRYRDLALEVEVDLSMVSHFATANSLEGIPRPLKDRMRILVMPTPGWQHLGTLTKQIVERLARERGLDARWYPPLAEDELDLVKAAWPGGSIRQLTRIVTTVIDGRDQIIGRC